MSRPVCRLVLFLTSAEWGELLSRVHHAEQLKELSLRIDSVSVHCVHSAKCVLLHVRTVHDTICLRGSARKVAPNCGDSA